jgi:predicted transcriptional regulator
MEKGNARTNKVTALITDEASQKLTEICKRLDRSKSWVICHLILKAEIEADLLPTTYGDGTQ